jgi:uncharacterized protein (TIGR02466 family)
MNENLEFTSYFGTPIYIVELPELVNSYNKESDIFINKSKKINKNLIKERKKFFKKNIHDFGMSYHSESLINFPQFKILQDYVSKRSYEILDHMGHDLSQYELFLTEFWVQEFGEKGGGHHEGHIHYDNHISGFYFLKCSDKTSMPVFHDPRPAKIMSQLPLKNIQEITSGSLMINYKPKPGTLILFPAFLEHQFAVDSGIEPFRFIHFNLQAVRKIILNVVRK